VWDGSVCVCVCVCVEMLYETRFYAGHVHRGNGCVCVTAAPEEEPLVAPITRA
jgi:hypothetical protein